MALTMSIFYNVVSTCVCLCVSVCVRERRRQRLSEAIYIIKKNFLQTVIIKCEAPPGRFILRLSARRLGTDRHRDMMAEFAHAQLSLHVCLITCESTRPVRLKVTYLPCTTLFGISDATSRICFTNFVVGCTTTSSPPQ